MSAQRSPALSPTGTGLVMLLLLCGVMIAAGMQWQRPHHLNDDPLVHRWPELRVNINTADEAQLCLLPGIGPRMAERVVRDREANGPFADVQSLTRVKWIGPVIVQRLEHHATVGDD